MEINVNRTKLSDGEIVKAVEAAIEAGETATASNDAMSSCGYSYRMTVEIGGEPIIVSWYPSNPDAEDENQCNWNWIDLATY